MARRLLVFPLLLLFVTAPAALAQKATGGEVEQEVRSILEKEEVTLTDLFRLVELANPTLAAAQSDVRARAGRVRQAGLYPNPAIEFEIEELSTSDSSDRKDKVSLVQPLILSGRRGAAVAAARAEQEVAAHTLRRTRRDLFRQAHTLWAEQLYFREADAALQGLLGVANRTLEIAQTRFDVRAAPESQVTKALLEVYNLEVAQQKLGRERVRASAELTALFGGAQVPLDRLTGTLNPDGATANSQILRKDIAQHPSVRSAAKGVDAAEATLREARAKRIPDLGLFVAAGRIRPTGEGFLEAGISVPLPVFNRNQGRVAESQALVAEAEARARIVVNDLQVALAAARARFLAIRDELQALNDRITPAAERGLSQAQEGYRVGRLSFLELIDTQRTLSNVRLRTLELRKALIVAEAELMSLVGTGPYGERGEES